MHHERRGSGPPLLLIHGLGGSVRSWDPIRAPLAAARETIAVDLPGFGRTPPLPGEVSIATLADAVERFLAEQGLDGVDVVGGSMGAQLVLELARRGRAGATVALDPGGFWNRWERWVFAASIWTSIRAVRLLEPALPALTANPAGRTILLAQLSARPWRVPADVALTELRSYAHAPSFDAALRSVVLGPPQEGLPRGAARAPIVLGWGRRDLVTLPRQAPRALARFPDARLHWFEGSGHFPHWDRPEETVALILEATAARRDTAS